LLAGYVKRALVKVPLQRRDLPLKMNLIKKKV